MSRRGENIYKRKDGRWEGRYKKGRKANGQIFYGYVYGKTYTETRQKVFLQKMIYQTEKKEQTIFAGTVTEWIQFWLSEQRLQLRDSTFSSYQHKLQKYVIPLFGEKTLMKLERQTLELSVTRWLNQGLSPTTIHVIIRVFKMVLESAVQQGILQENPCTDLSLPKMEKKMIRALTRNEQKMLEQAASQDYYGLPVLLALHTGLRIGELAALRWSDIDFSEKVICVTQTYQRLPLANDQKKTTLSLGKVKSASSQRTIPLSKQATQWLKDWKKQTDGEFLFMKSGRPIEPRLITYHFHRIRKKARLENVHFHQLRHTFATRCLEAKGDIASISALLGHSSAKMTLDVYTDTLFDQRKLTIQQMEKVIS